MFKNLSVFTRSGGAPSAHTPELAGPCAPALRKALTLGPVCPRCSHPTCRTIRAQALPLLGGHRAEYSHEHAKAAAIQVRYRHLVIWFGEATQSYWVMTGDGLQEAEDIDALLLMLWPHADPVPDPEPGPVPSRRPLIPWPRREARHPVSVAS
ncbi:hypothetical protein ACIBFB_14655 [Nocardiopsis sp. NPDC050513]|uniref:hypothetical protein n=1 Tax=Nocardiopsis sp. NPDC050513 TaxID=3364338 RepID=UPI0037AE3B87